MVQLTRPPGLDASPPPDHLEEARQEPGSPGPDSSPRSLSPLQLALSASAPAYPGYETYISNGLICLKHKIRNIEKKKLKLEDYTRRLRNGDALNKDQMEAVAKYEEVLHNLAFAKELHKTLDVLTQDLLKAQKKVQRREQVAQMEAERKRLHTVLQVQYVLQTLRLEHVRKDFLSGLNRALLLSARELERLADLAVLLGCQRDHGLSLEEQMEQAAVAYWDLLDGKDKPVVGSTYKHMKEQLAKMMDCGYFDNVPAPASPSLAKAEPPVPAGPKSLARPAGLAGLTKQSSNLLPTREFLNRRYVPEKPVARRGQDENWKAEFLALKEQEPPDSWDAESIDGPASPKVELQKPEKGAAGFIAKVTLPVKKPPGDPKPKRQKKLKSVPDPKLTPRPEATVEVFRSPTSLPKDPVLRKQKLEDLIDQIAGSFSFMQDSLLEAEASSSGLPKMSRLSLESSPSFAQEEQKKDYVKSTKVLHTTPLPVRLLPMEGKGALTNGHRSLGGCDLDLAPEESSQEKLQISDGRGFCSPPLFHRESSVSINLDENLIPQMETPSPCNGGVSSTPVASQAFSTPPSRRSISLASSTPLQTNSVFKVRASLPPSGDPNAKSDLHHAPARLRFCTASTQTPPELNPPEDEPLQLDPAAFQPECVVGGGGPQYPLSRSGHLYHARGTVRGMARAGRGLAHSLRSPGGHRGGFEAYRSTLRSPSGSCTPQTHTLREPSGSVLYGGRNETGFQAAYKRGGGAGDMTRMNSSAGWSDSSHVSSLDLEGTHLVDPGDSGHGDSLPFDVPVTPRGPHTLMPVHVYPVSQQMRVAFSAARTANFAPGSLDQPIAFDLLHSNLGEMFDVPSGRFTCPAAGTYVFIFHVLKLAVNVPLYINLMRNEEVMVSAYANDSAPDHETASNHAVLQLYQGDQVWLRLHRGAIYGSSWKYSTFSGFLLYQD
ncbi:caprin-2 isoform X1 [Denticeps clupeoides]|uniref:C1q domain-containing protein n=1 Tax=Denticeps clupeoides TaxID=299321 RepID=A0AAY4B062_9TELE|nr:caprin-2 isoform X1 [Denticeps clupeoides]XP_028810412.1 caprin-2 isoform X1 [Denticeps clupeoides]